MLSSSSSSPMDVSGNSAHESVLEFVEPWILPPPRVPVCYLGLLERAISPIFTIWKPIFFLDSMVSRNRKRIDELKGWISNLEARYNPGREREVWDICEEIDKLERNIFFGSSELRDEMEALQGSLVSLLKVMVGYRALNRARDYQQKLARFSGISIWEIANLMRAVLMDEPGAGDGADDVMKAVRKCEIRSLMDSMEIVSNLVNNSVETEGCFQMGKLQKRIMEMSSSIERLEEDDYCRRYFVKEMEDLKSQFSSLSRCVTERGVPQRDVDSVQDFGNPRAANLEGAPVSTGSIEDDASADLEGAWISSGSVRDASPSKMVNVLNPLHAGLLGDYVALAPTGNHMVKLKDGVASISRNVQGFTDNFTNLFGSSEGDYMPITDIPISTKVKMGKISNKADGAPLFPQKRNQDGELEDYADFAFSALKLSYAGLYCLLSATFGKMGGDNAKIMTGIHAWTFLMVLVFFIGSYARCSVRALKLMRSVMSILLFLSALVVFLLLEFTL